MSSSGGSESIASSASRDIINISVSSDSRDNNVSGGSSDISLFCDGIAIISVKTKVTVVTIVTVLTDVRVDTLVDIVMCSLWWLKPEPLLCKKKSIAQITC